MQETRNIAELQRRMGDAYERWNELCHDPESGREARRQARLAHWEARRAYQVRVAEYERTGR